MKTLSAISVSAVLAVCLCSCNETGLSEKAGKCVGEVYVTASPGSKTVLVDLKGCWKVIPQQDWLSTDVEGRDGLGAFTFSYASNESDLVDANPTRVGSIVIRSLTTGVSDTLYVRQQGTPDGKEYASAAQNSYVEFVSDPLTRLEVLYANFEGAGQESEVRSYISSCSADVLAFEWTAEGISALAAEFGERLYANGRVAILARETLRVSSSACSTAPESVSVDIEGVNFQIAAFDREADAYTQLVNLLESGYNRPGSSSKWLIGGSFYYLSAMEAGYPDTPQWYPATSDNPAFSADRYAISNNLTDCVWMTSRRFNPTFSGDGRSWRADYLYASLSVWNSAVCVRVLPAVVSGATHSAIEMIIKY